MLLSALLTYREGPVSQLKLLSHFLTFVWGKKIEVLVSMVSFSNIYAKLICRTDLLCDQPIFFVAQSVAQQILPSW